MASLEERFQGEYFEAMHGPETGASEYINLDVDTFTCANCENTLIEDDRWQDTEICCSCKTWHEREARRRTSERRCRRAESGFAQ
jgi:hypothetical protein